MDIHAQLYISRLLCTRLFYLCLILTRSETLNAMCNDGWAKNPHSEKCFKILNVYGSWNATRQKCSEQGADLVQIKDRAENLFFASINVSETVQYYWIGLSRSGSDEDFKWLDGDMPAYYLNWGPQAVDDSHSHCGAMGTVHASQAATWAKRDCSEHLLVVCEKNDPEYCPSGWILCMLSRTCIKLFAVYKSWSDARLVCNSNGGDLLTIRHSWMNSFIFDQLSSRLKENYWIGLNDRAREGHFRWLDEFEKAPYTNWRNKQSRVRSLDQDCVVINRVGYEDKWSVIDCNKTARFICERERDCPIGTYGRKCDKACSVHCNGTRNPCNGRNGFCTLGCNPGYIGRKCLEACQAGRYGHVCSENCSRNCAGPEKRCRHEDGTCLSGCIDGYEGRRCESAPKDAPLISNVFTVGFITTCSVIAVLVVGILLMDCHLSAVYSMENRIVTAIEQAAAEIEPTEEVKERTLENWDKLKTTIKTKHRVTNTYVKKTMRDIVIRVQEGSSVSERSIPESYASYASQTGSVGSHKTDDIEGIETGSIENQTTVSVANRTMSAASTERSAIVGRRWSIFRGN